MGAAPRTPSRVGSSSRVIASSIAAPAPLHCSIDLIATKKNLPSCSSEDARPAGRRAGIFTPQLRRRIEQVARIWSTSRHNCAAMPSFDMVRLFIGCLPRSMRNAGRAEN
jgi:hypothetical protein